MAKKKENKAPKIPAKQQMYEQILTKQLYGAPPTREEGIAKLQADYDAWNERQQGIAKLQSEYDNWLNEQKKTQQPVKAPRIDTVKDSVRQTPTIKMQNKVEMIASKSEAKEKKYLTHADVIPSLNKKAVEKQAQMNKVAQNKAESISKIANQLGISEDEVRQRMTAPKQELNAYDEKKIDKNTTEKYQKASSEAKRKAAQKKYNPWEAFTGRFAKATTDIVNAPVAIAGKLTGKNWSLYNDAQKQEFKDLKEQHPVASSAGDLAGMAFAAYMTGGGNAGTMAKEGAANAGQVFNALRDEAILNGASKGVAATQALKGAIPTLAANAASNMPTDFAVDIIPTLANDIAEGEKTNKEIIRDTLLNTGVNYGFNALGDAVSLGKAMKKAGNPITADDAFRTNALEGYEKLKRLNEIDAQKATGNLKKYGNLTEVNPNKIINSNSEIDSIIKNNPSIDIVGSNVRKTPDVISSEKNNINNQIISYMNGTMRPSEFLDLGHSSDILQKYGVTDDNLYMLQRDIRKVLGKAGDNVRNPHNIGTGAFEAIPEKLEDPIAIIRSSSKNAGDSVVVLTDLVDVEGNPVLAAIRVNGDGNVKIENQLTSYYGKNDIQKYLSEQSKRGNILYINKIKASTDPAGHGLQSPAPVNPEASISDIRSIRRAEADTTSLSDLNVPKENLNVNKNSVNFELPEETFDKIDSHFEELARPLNEVQNSGIMDNVTDEKALAEWANVNEAYSDYLDKAMFGESVEEAEAAKKALDNARKRYARAMKEIDPEISKAFNSGSFGYKIGRPLNERNVNAFTEQGQEAFDAINELENFGNAEKNFANPNVSKAPEAVSEPILRNVEEIEPSVEDMVESGQSRHIRGAGEMQMEGVSDEVVADFQDNPQMHSVLRNADTKAKAESIYNTSNNPEVEFRDMLRQHDPAALPLGHQIAKDYSAAGNHEAAAQIYREMGEQLTKAGQFSQAAVINMMKNDPLTALQYAQRQIDTLNQQGLKRFGSKWNDFKLTDDEIKLFDNITPGDEDAIKAAYDTIGERLGKEYPTSFMDKLLEGRKIAMLFNVRTNIRNAGANVPTLGMRWAADRVEALGQNVAHLINPNFKVTQAVTGSGIQGRKLATEAFNSPRVQTMLEGTSGKYEIPDLKNSLVKNKQMYKGTRLEKWLDNITDGGIQKINEILFGKKGVQSGLETVRNATYKMLDLGDSPFVKENFVERLGSYINAQKIKNLDDIPDEAIEMAWEEAMKATYKDESWAVKMLSKIKGGMESVPVVGRPISQGAIPFLQAPGNIAARMVDYSPIRGSKGVADIISGARANDLKKVTRGIEEASKGLTGTGMVLLGMKLRESGILTGTYSKDKDQKAFEKQNGFKEFALHIGDKYFTYDWAQPFAQSLITGTLLEDAIEKSDENNSDLLAYIDEKAGTNFNGSMVSKVAGVAGEAAKASLNSWFNASPLQGLKELLSGNYTDKDDIASSIKQTLVDDFAGAFVPSAVNAVAKSVDPVQRNTTDKTNSTATFVNQQIAKIPGLSKTLPAKYDTWGREMKYADSKAMATASRFVIPGDYSYDRSDKVDKEIGSLYEKTQDAAVFPQVAPYKVGDKTLDNKEVSEYQKDMGERSRKLVEAFMKSDSYKKMDDKDKVEEIKKLYGVSKAITERDKFGKELSNSSEYKNPITEYDKVKGGDKGVDALVNYYTGKSMATEAGLSASSNAAKVIQQDIQSGNIKAAEQKVEAATTISNLGLDKPGPTYTYYNAQKVIPELTPEKFAKTYKSIDADGNQGIKQDEIINYLNNNNLSESEGKKIWNAYGNSTWKSIPSLKDGKWSKSKK